MDVILNIIYYLGLIEFILNAHGRIARQSIYNNPLLMVHTHFDLNVKTKIKRHNQKENTRHENK